MRSPEGRDFWSTGVYREIVPLERLVCSDSFADEKGNVVPASHYGMGSDFPLELQVTVTFEDQDGKTKMTLRHVGMPAGQMSEMAEAGWTGSFDKLAEAVNATTFALPSDREILVERLFDAPRELVFKAHTEPRLIPRWWGPGRLTTTVDKMDVRPGGLWRFVQRDASGNEYAFNGEYREILAPERVAYTFEFEGMPGHVLTETATFEEHDGKTKLTVTDVFDTAEDRDGMLQSGMEEGAAESQYRLAQLLADLSD